MTATKRSNVPVWLTLGFAAGLGFGWMAFNPETPRRSPPLAHPGVAETPPDLPKDAGTLGAVEQTFQRWGGYAVWKNDVTEIALWSVRRRRFADFYEVRRSGGKFYFRTLAQLTRPLIDHGARSNLPIQFTEPQAARDEFYRAHPDYDPATESLVDPLPRPPAPAGTNSYLPSSPPPPPPVPPSHLRTPDTDP